MELDNSFLMMTFQDVDGFIVDGTTYKALNGAKLIINQCSYPSVTLKSNVGTDGKPSVIINTTDTFRDRLAPNSYGGYDRPTLSMTARIPIRNDVATQAKYFGTPATYYTTSSIVPMDYYILFNLWMFNHRIYLKDVNQASGTYTNLGLPINILCNRTDWFNNTIFSTNGIPVIITGLSISDYDFDVGDSQSAENYMIVKIDMVVD